MFVQFLKYNVVGIVNTFLGFSIIYGLMFMGVSPIVSNAVGYAIGMIVSYFLNVQYTFKMDKHSPVLAVKFFIVLGCSYLFNFAILYWLLEILNPYIAQLGAMIVYTVNSFVMIRYFVFR